MISKIIEYILSIPKSLYFCLRMLPLKNAVKLPILLRYNVKTRSLSGSCDIVGGGHLGKIRIGFGEVGCFDKKYQRTILEISGHVRFKGKCFIGNGSKIVVGKNGILEFGDNFIITANSTIISYKHIFFGDKVLISWDCLLMDTDFHYVIDKETEQVSIRDKEIAIGNHVWIGCKSTILKGCKIMDDSVIASNSVVTKPICEGSVLIAGNPATIKKYHYSWKFK